MREFKANSHSPISPVLVQPDFLGPLLEADRSKKAYNAFACVLTHSSVKARVASSRSGVQYVSGRSYACLICHALQNLAEQQKDNPKKKVAKAEIKVEFFTRSKRGATLMRQFLGDLLAQDLELQPKYPILDITDSSLRLGAGVAGMSKDAALEQAPTFFNAYFWGVKNRNSSALKARLCGLAICCLCYVACSI